MSQRRKRRREKEFRHRRMPRGRIAAGTGLTLGAAFALSPAAQAADFTVDDSTDAPLGTCDIGTPNDCSIRDAVDLSNTTGGPDRILFASSLTGSVITLVDQLAVTDDVEILGLGAGALEINGGGPSPDGYRIFDIYGGAANVTVSGLTLRDGLADQSDGGAIRSQGSNLIVTNSVITGNGAKYAPDMSPDPTFARGGGIASFGGSLEVRNSTLTDNYAVSYIGTGGGIYAEGTDPVTVSDSTLTVNYAVGIFAPGGGIATEDAGEVTIERSTLQENHAFGDGYSIGGGVSTDSSDEVMIERSTVAGNTAAAGGGVWSDEEELTVLNSTASGNEAKYAGGGISSSEGEVGLTNSTVAGNSATEVGSVAGGMFLCGCTDAAISNSILADNTADDGPDLYISSGPEPPPNTAFSLIEAPVGGDPINETVPGSNRLGVDPQLGALAANGGPTQTMALPMTSPAVDAGSNFGTGIDQRGLQRPFDITSVANSAAAGANGSDIGAFELNEQSAAAAADCNGVAATIVGTAAGETIEGTSGPDVIRARGGDDVIRGRGGKDLICADDGNDTVRSGKGKDEVLGSNGDDRLRGGGGGDRLIGGNDRDRIFGQAGNDTMFGGTLESSQGPSAGPSALINRCSGGKGTDEATGCDVVKGVP